MKTAISLFSGMGGDTLGLENAGYRVIAYSEIDKIFQKTHELNFPKSKIIGCGNILKTSDEDFLIYKGKVSLIFAGFPCQGFSQAGKKLPDDPRNTLFTEFLRATRLIKPDYIIGENVKGLLNRKTVDGDNFIDIIKKEFEDIGYNISYKVLKCHEYNIPQKRERLIIVGIKKEMNKEYIFPEKIDRDTNLIDIIKFNMKGSIKINKIDYDMSTISDECIKKDMNNTETEGVPHPNLKLLAKDKDYIYKDKTYSRRITFGKRIPVGGEIIDIRNPAKTIICTYARQPRLFVPLQNKAGYYLRCLLPDELKKIQGFPENYKLHGNITKQIIQIGNAIPPPLVDLIVHQLNI